MLLRSSFRLAGQAGSGQLSSNVRQHRNVCALPSLHGAASSRTQMRPCGCPNLKHVRALGGAAMNLSQTSTHCAAESLNTYKGLGSLWRTAVRVSLLGPPVILRAAHQSRFAFASVVSGFLLVLGAFAKLEQAGRKRQPPRVLGTTLSSPLFQAYTRSTERQYAVLPNPSIERTSTGLARSTSLVHVPLRGPSRFRPAHVKR
jgi:hypothetical protein